MGDKLFSFAATETGYNHIKAKPSKVCEDASGFYDDDQMHICVVSDGHGSDNYPRTDRGSQFAVEAAIEQIKVFVEEIYNPDPENPEESKSESDELIEKLLHAKINENHLLHYLSRNILLKWREYVEKDVEENPFQELEMLHVSEKYKKRYMSENRSERRTEKAYGCTLIAYVITDRFSFGMQIGDGKCVVIDQNGSVSEPIPWDDNCQFNVTTSICDSDASDEFRFFVTEEAPAVVFCGSDGIDDSYPNIEDMYALYRSILTIFVEHGVSVGKSEIKEYLPVLTKRGSGDDVSIALIMDLQRVTELMPVLTAQTELYNSENQLKEKQHLSLVNEEKEKALTTKLATFIRPGTRRLLDQEICDQINELRFQMNQTDEEIFFLQRKIDSLKLRMPNIVASCVSDKGDVEHEVADIKEKTAGEGLTEMSPEKEGDGDTDSSVCVAMNEDTDTVPNKNGEIETKETIQDITVIKEEIDKEKFTTTQAIEILEGVALENDESIEEQMPVECQETIEQTESDPVENKAIEPNEE